MRLLAHLLLSEVGRVPSKHQTRQEVLLGFRRTTNEMLSQGRVEKLNSFCLETGMIVWRKTPQVIHCHETWVVVSGGSGEQTLLYRGVNESSPQSFLDVNSGLQMGLGLAEQFPRNKLLKVQLQQSGAPITRHPLDNWQCFGEKVRESFSPSFIFHLGCGARKLLTVQGGSTRPSSVTSGGGNLDLEAGAVMTLATVVPSAHSELLSAFVETVATTV